MTTADNAKKTAFRRRTVLAMAIGVAAAAAAASALAKTDPVDLQVVDRDTGRPLRIWRHHGRLFVAGEPGARYGLRVTNHTGGRVLVVMSVDGVNILTGETAGYDQRGYVFDPYETYDINGWRKSDSVVAAFAFAPLSRSYAARTGRPSDVGVIGVAVFKERAPPPMPEPEASVDDSASFAGRGAPAPTGAPALSRAAPPPMPASPGQFASESFARRDEKLGTAHGAREWSAVTTVSFERATSYPESTRQIEYDTYAHLVAAGVIPSWRREEPHPRPFPSDHDDEGYVPDPPEP